MNRKKRAKLFEEWREATELRDQVRALDDPSLGPDGFLAEWEGHQIVAAALTVLLDNSHHLWDDLMALKGQWLNAGKGP